jgi:hypothetical protein
MTSSEVTVTMSVLSSINAIVITSGGTEITAADDIRIKIPSNINAEWLTSGTSLTIVNPATGVVSATASYPDARTMLLDVTTNFASGESLQITTGATFTPVYGASAAAPLQWSVDGGVTYGNANANTNVTVASTVYSGFSSTEFTSSVVGATNTTTINGVAVQYPSVDTGSLLEIVMPANYDISGVSYASDSLGGGSNFSTCTPSGQTVVCTTLQSIAGAGNAAIVLNGIKAAYVGDASTASYTFTHNSPTAIQTISNDIVVPATTVGALSSTNVEPASLSVSAATTATISFTTSAAIPNLGKIVVTFPDGYDVSGANGTTASSLSGLNGTWTASVAGQIVTFTQTGGSSSSAGAKSLTVSGITTPSTTGSTGTYAITTKIAAGNNIETAAAVSADTLVSGENRRHRAPTDATVVTPVTLPILPITPNIQETPVLLPPPPLIIPRKPAGSSATSLQPYFKDSKSHWLGYFIKKLFEMGVISGKTTETFQPDQPLTRAEMVKIALLTFQIKLDSQAKSTFLDVTEADWFAPYLATAQAKGLINGHSDGMFKPNDPVNRAEALKILLSASGLDLGDGQISPFSDVQEADWFAPYVDFAYSKAIVSGKTATTFNPGGTFTRAEMAKIAVLASRLK